MKKYLIIIMVISMTFLFGACGSEEADAPTAYSPSDIQVEDADGVNVYSVIYDVDISDTEAWSGYDSDDVVKQTAIEGIKACMDRDDWSDDSIVYGYANEALLKNMMYSYGQDGDYTGIELYQIGIYNDTYTLQGELD